MCFDNTLNVKNIDMMGYHPLIHGYIIKYWKQMRHNCALKHWLFLYSANHQYLPLALWNIHYSHFLFINSWWKLLVYVNRILNEGIWMFCTSLHQWKTYCTCFIQICPSEINKNNKNKVMSSWKYRIFFIEIFSYYIYAINMIKVSFLLLLPVLLLPRP